MESDQGVHHHGGSPRCSSYRSALGSTTRVARTTGSSRRRSRKRPGRGRDRRVRPGIPRGLASLRDPDEPVVRPTLRRPGSSKRDAFLDSCGNRGTPPDPITMMRVDDWVSTSLDNSARPEAELTDPAPNEPSSPRAERSRCRFPRPKPKMGGLDRQEQGGLSRGRTEPSQRLTAPNEATFKRDGSGRVCGGASRSRPVVRSPSRSRNAGALSPRSHCPEQGAKAIVPARILGSDRGAMGIINIGGAMFVPAPSPGHHTTRDPA
jgi:hypothetical protein